MISIARLLTLMLGDDRTNRLERGPQGLKVETQQREINEPRRTLFTNEGCDSTPPPTPPWPTSSPHPNGFPTQKPHVGFLSLARSSLRLQSRFSTLLTALRHRNLSAAAAEPMISLRRLKSNQKKFSQWEVCTPLALPFSPPFPLSLQRRPSLMDDSERRRVEKEVGGGLGGGAFVNQYR